MRTKITLTTLIGCLHYGVPIYYKFEFYSIFTFTFTDSISILPHYYFVVYLNITIICYTFLNQITSATSIKMNFSSYYIIFHFKNQTQYKPFRVFR